MIFGGVISRIARREARTCPKCGATQKVLVSKKDVGVNCKICGASILPIRSASSDTDAA